MAAADTPFSNGAAAAIGSLPHRDIAAAAAFAIAEFDIATVPTLPKVGDLAAMALTAVDLDDSAYLGLHAFLDLARKVNLDGIPVSWHFPGPVTLGAALHRAGLEPAEAFALAVKTVRTKLIEVFDVVATSLPGSPQLVMLDEPALADLMDPEFPIPPDHAVDLMSSGMAAVSSHATVGIHCDVPCDIATLLASGPGVMSIPAHPGLIDWAGYLNKFLEDGGVIAWGAVPAGGPVSMVAERHWRALSDLWCELVRRGCEPVALRRQSMVTPTAGLHGHSASTARRIARMNADVAKRVRDQAAATRFALGA